MAPSRSSWIDSRANSISGCHARGFPASSSARAHTASFAARSAASCGSSNTSPCRLSPENLCSCASRVRWRTKSASSVKASMLLGSSTKTARNWSSRSQSLGGWARGRRRRPTRLAVGRRRKARNSFCRRDIASTLSWLYARRMATSTSDFANSPASEETLRLLRNGSGMLATAAVRRLDEELKWFRELEAENRSWVGLVAQAGISAFISWFEKPHLPSQATRSEEHTSELQSRGHLVCRHLLEKKKTIG